MYHLIIATNHDILVASARGDDRVPTSEVRVSSSAFFLGGDGDITFVMFGLLEDISFRFDLDGSGSGGGGIEWIEGSAVFVSASIPWRWE